LQGENWVCEDVISEMACEILRKIAKTLKLKVEIVDKIIREAIAKGITSAKGIFDFVRHRLVEWAKNFKCTDILSEKVCTTMKQIAEKIKVKFTEIVKFMKDIIGKGIMKIKEIIDAIKKHFFPHNDILAELADANTVTCEDVLSAKVCAELRAAAEKLKVKVAVIDQIIREAIHKKITKAKEIIQLVRHRIVELAKNVKCTDVLPEEACTKIHDIAEKLKIKIAEVDKVLKEIIAKGITKIKEIIKKIKEHFHFENEVFFISNFE